MLNITEIKIISDSMLRSEGDGFVKRSIQKKKAITNLDKIMQNISIITNCPNAQKTWGCFSTCGINKVDRQSVVPWLCTFLKPSFSTFVIPSDYD